MLIPRPRVNLILYHGVLAAHATRRAAAVGTPPVEGGEALPSDALGSSVPPKIDGSGRAHRPPPAAEPTRTCLRSDPSLEDAPERPRPRYHRWADLMRRTFEIDVLQCRRCGGRMRLIATIEDPEIVRKLLDHLGLPTELPRPLPARAPPVQTEFAFPHYD